MKKSGSHLEEFYIAFWLSEIGITDKKEFHKLK